jgi:hypothetical protein
VQRSCTSRMATVREQATPFRFDPDVMAPVSHSPVVEPRDRAWGLGRQPVAGKPVARTTTSPRGSSGSPAHDDGIRPVPG